LDKALVTELIQGECTLDNISIELDKMINDNTYIKNIENGYNEIKNILGSDSVSIKVADSIIKMLSQ
jgi:lipid A disaccharide synthetase